MVVRRRRAGRARAFDKRGGYYVYGLLEDSDSFARGVPVEQDVLQAAISVDDFVGPLRLETGVNTQMSRTAGALTGRFTQDLVDTGRYIRGTPLVESRSERQRRDRLSGNAARLRRCKAARDEQPAADPDLGLADAMRTAIRCRSISSRRSRAFRSRCTTISSGASRSRTRRARCARRASAVRVPTSGSRARSAWCSTRARSATTRSICAAPALSSASCEARFVTLFCRSRVRQRIPTSRCRTSCSSTA